MDVKKEQLNQFNDLDISSELLQNLKKTDHANVCKRIKALKEFMNIEVTDIQQVQLLAGHVEDFNKLVTFKDSQGRNIIFYALWSESIEVLRNLFETQRDLIKLYTSFKQPIDLDPGIDTIIMDCGMAAGFLENIQLLDWLFDNQFFENEIKKVKKSHHQYNLLQFFSMQKWIEALDRIHAIAPDCIQSHSKAIINVGIKCKLSVIFQWATRHLYDQMMTPECMAKAIDHGMLEAVQWFLANAPEAVLNYRSANGTTIFHLAASSKSNRVFKAITELNNVTINQCDMNGASIVEYALNSPDMHRINNALKLLGNPAELHFMKTPRRFVDTWNNTCDSIDLTIYNMKVEKLLDCNFTLQTINGKFSEESGLKIERNKIIARFEQLKPVIILCLCISRENKILHKISFEIIQEIIKKIRLFLPENVPETTIDCYRNNFFNNIQNENPLKEYEADSQEECYFGSDSDEERCIGLN